MQGETLKKGELWDIFKWQVHCWTKRKKFTVSLVNASFMLSKNISNEHKRYWCNGNSRAGHEVLIHDLMLNRNTTRKHMLVFWKSTCNTWSSCIWPTLSRNIKEKLVFRWYHCKFWSSYTWSSNQCLVCSKWWQNTRVYIFIERINSDHCVELSLITFFLQLTGENI